MVTEEEMKAVRSVKVEESSQPYILAWELTKNGEFTVKSAYYLEMQRRTGSVGGSDPDLKKSLWKRLWKAMLPQKVKKLMWRAVNNGLPTMDTLAKRGIDVDRICPRCGEEVETTTHLMLHCTESRLLWLLTCQNV